MVALWRIVMREYVAMTKSASGATRAVTVRAHNESEARETLARMGYSCVLWVL